MTMINPLAAALAAVLEQAVQAALQASNDRLEAHIARLDAHVHQLDALADRVAALESSPAGTLAAITADAFVAHLDNQEWFWEKLTRKAHEVAESAAEEALDSHTSDYDHDEYDSHLQDDDRHPDSDIEDAVRSALNGTSVTLSF